MSRILFNSMDTGLADELTKEYGKSFQKEIYNIFLNFISLLQMNRLWYMNEAFYIIEIKCYVIIDLKMGKITHQDVGQIDTVNIGTWGCRWFRKRDGGSAEVVHIIGVALLTGEVLGLSDTCAELIDNQ